MKTPKFVQAIGNTAGRIWFKTKRKTPELCLIAGIVGFGVTVYSACRSMKKVDAVKESMDAEKQEIEKLTEKAEDPIAFKRRETGKLYVRTIGKYVMIFGPAIAAGGMTLTSFLVSYHVLKERNLVLGAAYHALDKGFKLYRARVAERFGEEVEKELMFGLNEQSHNEAEDKPEAIIPAYAQTVNAPVSEFCSVYARFFDESCAPYEKDAEQNLIFLKGKQNEFNVKLHARRYVFLNEVYRALGLPETKAGQHVGWIYDDKNPTGDNFISFGISQVHRERSRAFVNGLENAILLDFNVDGVIDNDPRVFSYEI